MAKTAVWFEMSDPLRRLRLVVWIMGLLVLLGTLGYRHIEHLSLLDSLYMTVITLSTVGYREVKNLSPWGKIFTVLLIVVGVGTLAWGLQNLVDTIINEHLTRTLWRRRMNRFINRMKGHYIVCGHGRMGQQIATQLKREGKSFVVIEKDPGQVSLLERLGYAFLIGDATEDEVLLAAGIQRARGLVAVGPTEADNLFITLSARGLNPEIYIVARSARVEDEEKLRRAGANRVLSPYVTGGRRMAVALLRPTVADFLDVVMHAEDLEFQLEEVTVAEGSPLAGCTIANAEALAAPGPTVVGMKRHEGEIQVRPVGNTAIHAGDTLILLGTEDQIETVRRAAKVEKREAIAGQKNQ